MQTKDVLENLANYLYRNRRGQRSAIKENLMKALVALCDRYAGQTPGNVEVLLLLFFVITCTCDCVIKWTTVKISEHIKVSVITLAF